MKQPLHDRAQVESKPLTYLALGDSYTVGEKVAAKENFPNQVTAMLQENGFDFNKPKIVAQTGWTTDELQEAIEKAKLSRPFDFVTLLIGVNNQYRGRRVEDYTPEFESILSQAVRLANNDSSHVIVLSIPDWGVTPFAEGRDRKMISNQIDAYNAANKQVADKYKVHYLNITPGTREAANNTELLTSDGLHPSGKEYRRWAVEIAELIRSLK
ncbi:MAG: SGNH/GDSL hydrolase family protein [Chitinophagaceae bacterium]|nr:SGNH/GDSL hydrolase family protein [Chitinophagaceae bacterium]